MSKYKETLTIHEFREIIRLPENYKITKSQVNQFVKMFRGSYLLWNDYLNISEKTFKLATHKRTITIIPTIDMDCTRSFAAFIENCSSKAKLRVDQYLHKNGKDKCHFWSYTEFDDRTIFGNPRKLTKQIWESAYQMFIGKFLAQIQCKYVTKYGILLKYRDYSKDHSSPGIWLDGVEFPFILFYDKNTSRSYRLSSYEICQIICRELGGHATHHHKTLVKILNEI